MATKSKAGVLIVIAALLIAIASWISMLLTHASYHYAMSRTRFDPGAATGGLFEGFFVQHQFQSISNLFMRQQVRLELAKQSAVPESEVKFTGIGPVKGTRIFYVIFEGTDTNHVFNVASNAANTLVAWYATNETTWAAQYIDTFHYLPKTDLEQKLERIRYSIFRFW